MNSSNATLYFSSQLPHFCSVTSFSFYCYILCYIFFVLFHVEDKYDTLSKLKVADIIVTDCDLFLPYLDKLQSLKWVQTTWASVEGLIPNIKDKNVNYVITRFSDNTFGFAMAEYVVAHIFNFERNQKQQYENQKNSQWGTDGKISNHRLICDLSVGILGLGNIGKSSK